MLSIHRDLDRDDESKSFITAPSAEKTIYAYREFACLSAQTGMALALVYPTPDGKLQSSCSRLP